jgi:anti-sigma B factor antagonist
MVLTSGTTTGEPVVLHFTGDIDLATGQVVLNAVDAALAQGARSIVVDLSLVTFFGSSGIHTLIEGRARAAAAGGSMTITEMSRPVHRALAVSDAYEQLGLESPD